MSTQNRFSEAREELRRLLIERGFVRSRDGEPLLDRRGMPISWVYYGGEVNLSWRGLELTASVLLDKVSSFSSTQIATYGVSAIPLLAACVARGQGRYSGLVIRKEKKPYGAGRRIDGPIDRARSAVVIDESISSGRTAYAAICALEAEGVRVEGVICMVEFSGYGAADWLRSRGYRVETVFDVWRDLERPGVRCEAPPNPADVAWSADRAPSGLSPAKACRLVAQSLAATGLSPQPPASFDADYDTRGGVFVSVRRRADDVRLARGGFRRDAPDRSDAPQDVVLAANLAFRQALPGTFENIEPLKFAVSFLSAMDPIQAGQIDHRQHALVVRGMGPLDRTGFALPNTPHYDDDLEQYRYARTFSGNFWRLEPHTLYRQRVQRVVEPGASWPAYGAPPSRAGKIARRKFARSLFSRSRQILRAALGEPVGVESPAIFNPGEPLCGVGISIYLEGLSGCAVGWSGDLDAALREASLGALDDERYDGVLRRTPSERFVVVVSLLLRPRVLGRVAPERLELFYRLGRDTLQAAGNGRSAVVLAQFAVHQGIGPRPYQEQVLRKAGLHEDAAQWTAYETASWLVTAEGGRCLELGFPSRRAPKHPKEAYWRALANEIAGFVVGHRSADGLPVYMIRPFNGAAEPAGTATRILIGLTGVLEARGVVADRFVEQAEVMVGLFVAGGEVARPRAGLVWDSGSDAQLLTCLSQLGQRDRHRLLALKLIGRLKRLIREDGAIHAGVLRMPADLDFLSGSVLLALARASEWLGSGLENVDLAASLAFYRRRFRLSRPWGMVWWHGQAWTALAEHHPEVREFAFELVDWAIQRQSETSGAFVIDGLEPQQASFLTACVLEGVAEALGGAYRAGDSERVDRYARSWRRGARFVERLTIRQGDSFFCPDPSVPLGGVRPTLTGSELRIDYAGHALLALAKGLRAAALG